MQAKFNQSNMASGQALVNGDTASTEIMQFLSSSVRDVRYAAFSVSVCDRVYMYLWLWVCLCVREEQNEVINRLAKQLQTLQYEVDVKPSADTVESMVKLIETAFKRQLGENVVGTWG